jgi:hypothetical protein
MHLKWQKENLEDGLMANKKRVPMQVSPDFENRIKKIQKEIMQKHGMNISMREITEKIAKTPDFENLEKFILGIDRIDININFDRRKKCL